jgi:hypothetical protein
MWTIAGTRQANLQAWPTRAVARRAIVEYIAGFGIRLHRTLGLVAVLAGSAGDRAGTAGGQSQGPRSGAVRGGGLDRLPRIEKQVLVTLSTDSRAGDVMWLLSVGGRAYAGQNGDLQESC